MNNQNENDIVIPYSDLEDAADNIIYDKYSEYELRIDRDSIMKVLKEHLEYLIEYAISEPLEYFINQKKFEEDLDRSVYLDLEKTAPWDGEI